MDELMKQHLKKTLGKNIRFLRKNTKVPKGELKKLTVMSQGQLAKRIGSIEQQVSKWELAKNELSAIQIYKISQIFGVSVDSLYDDNLNKSYYSKNLDNDIYA